MKYFVLILICATINSLDDTKQGYRKQYGLSFHKNCGNYFVTFKCMTACKSMGYQVFRLDYRCKCTCHELKTTSILPAFVWRTNGTTKKRPSTYSPKLYDVVGTLSPVPYVPDSEADYDSDGKMTDSYPFPETVQIVDSGSSNETDYGNDNCTETTHTNGSDRATTVHAAAADHHGTEAGAAATTLAPKA